jgi:hypothetical protein
VTPLKRQGVWQVKFAGIFAAIMPKPTDALAG